MIIEHRIQIIDSYQHYTIKLNPLSFLIINTKYKINRKKKIRLGFQANIIW